MTARQFLRIGAWQDQIGDAVAAAPAGAPGLVTENGPRMAAQLPRAGGSPGPGARANRESWRAAAIRSGVHSDAVQSGSEPHSPRGSSGSRTIPAGVVAQLLAAAVAEVFTAPSL